MWELRTWSLASQPAAWRMPRKRGLAAMWASSTGPTPSPSVRSAKLTMPAATRVGPYRPLRLIAATPPTNSVSPTGRMAAGPSARYIDMHSTNTVDVTLCPLPVSAISSSIR